jgi:hypothetical protein
MNHEWRHTDPYPTNPCERVDGKELERLHKLRQPPPVYEEALL